MDKVETQKYVQGLQKENKELNNRVCDYEEKIKKCEEERKRFFEDTPFGWELDKIARDIMDRQDNAMAMEFTRTIAELLRENGIVVNCRENSFINSVSNKRIAKTYGIVFDSVDCSEHDKPFKDEIKQLKCDLREAEKKIDELKSDLLTNENSTSEKCDLIGLAPIEVANFLINAQGEYERNSVEKAIFGTDKGKYNLFDISELRQIAEHLLVYCNHNSEERGQ